MTITNPQQDLISAMVDTYWIQSYAASVTKDDKLWIGALARAISEEPTKVGRRFFQEWYEALHEPKEKRKEKDA